MDLNLHHRVVVVTGASRGTGLAVMRAFVAEGARVVAGARTISQRGYGSRAAGRVLERQRSGVAGDVQSQSDVRGACHAKCATLSKELGPQGIRVNTVSPGPVATDPWLGAGGVAQTVAGATGVNPGDVAEQAAHAAVTGRFSQPSEIAEAVLFLASDLSSNVTGADLTIDGGLVPTW